MNGIFLPMKISATGLEAQKVRLNLIASNIANINSTRTPGGGPYRRKDAVFQAYLFGDGGQGVDVVKVVDDPRPFKKVYEPGHPDADKSGYVSYPNIEVVEEMVNLMTATRAYEANLTLIDSFKDMFNKTIALTSI